MRKFRYFIRYGEGEAPEGWGEIDRETYLEARRQMRRWPGDWEGSQIAKVPVGVCA